MSDLLSIRKLNVENGKFPGYFVVSTAPINIEDAPEAVPQAGTETDPKKVIQEITQYLKDHQENAEILVMIHGYNTGKAGAEHWYKTTCEYISQHYSEVPKGLILIGYRWSSEQIVEDESGSFKDKRKFAKDALPKLMSLLTRLGIIGLIVGFVGTIVSLFVALSQIYSGLELLLAFVFLLVISLVVVAPVLTIIALRLTVYFRDTFRASNYGVIDLVEFIRQLDSALIEQAEGDHYEQAAHWDPRRIRLSFIGHSMGAFVVTNAVRILSDVFDKKSIGNLDVNNINKCPSSAIGNVFRLGKLVLVAPDIPVETIISGRANTLRSSLRRFEEAYLFSNEGDMALRLASTSANYFSFPAKTRDGGYRLGNVIVRNALLSKKRKQMLGIVNQLEDGQIAPTTGSTFLNYLFTREQKPLSARQEQIGLEKDQRSIAELFTYFDCTNYTEKYLDPKTNQEKEVGIVSKAIGKSFLSFWDYVSLSLDFFTGKIDTHGGYIFSPHADLSKRLIYGLSCLGFKGFLKSLQSDPFFLRSLEEIKTQHSNLSATQQTEFALLQTLSRQCSAKGIQVLLAPERYEVDILNRERDRKGY